MIKDFSKLCPFSEFTLNNSLTKVKFYFDQNPKMRFPNP
jgi:hypothetical protein